MVYRVREDITTLRQHYRSQKHNTSIGTVTEKPKIPGKARETADETAFIGRNPEFASGTAMTAAVVE